MVNLMSNRCFSPFAEKCVYYLIWTGSIFYSIYHVYLASLSLKASGLSQDLVPGWSWIGRPKDTADYEWQAWIPYLRKLTPWLVVHFLGNIFFKYAIKNFSAIKKETILYFWYMSVTIHFVYNHLGTIGILTILIQPCISSLLLAINSKTITWIVNIMILMAINYSKSSDTIYEYFSHLEIEDYYMLTNAVCWTQLRSISFVMDNQEFAKTVSLKQFFKLLLRNTAYNLYLPNMFLGPVILYNDFIKGITSHVPWNMKRLLRHVFNLARFIFWYFFVEFATHYVYVNSLQDSLKSLQLMNSWAFYGFGYCMGQYFHLKYVVIYGLGSEIARMDDIEAPPTPKCIGRIHHYSDMWKHFDVGLYNFLLKYIYLPIVSYKFKGVKFLGSLMCFAFVFKWHGIQQFIFIWSGLNFVGITIESIARSIGSSAVYQLMVVGLFSRRGAERLHCALSAPLLAMSAVSNFYFFGGLQVGHLFVKRFFQITPVAHLVLLFCLYCCCQVSQDVKSREKKNRSKKE